MSLADLPRYEMRQVASLDELCQLLHARGNTEVILLAGGTDFLAELSQGGLRAEPFPLVVDVSRLAEIRGICEDDKLLSIGAGTTYLEMYRSPVIAKHLPLIQRMTLDIGGPTIQARGTLGGNLATASPAADGVAAIAALDATIVLRSVRGTRRIAMNEFQTGYKTSQRADDEVITAIEMVPPAEGSFWCWRKVGTRLAQAISKVALAAVAEVDSGRVQRFGLALASVAPVTAMMPNTRKLVMNAMLADISAAELDEAVTADISPIDDIRSTGSYRAHCARSLVRDFLRQLGAAF